MEPTPICAALADAGPDAAPPRRSVPELLRALRDEARTAPEAARVSSGVETRERGHVGHVPGLLTFRLPA